MLLLNPNTKAPVTQTFFINLTPWAFQKYLEIVTDKDNACGRRGLWSCCGDCISPLPLARGCVCVFLLLSPSQRVDLAPQFLGNKPSPPLKLVFYFFAILNVMSRKPSFMAIIAQLITLWRLQTCVTYIFPSSHLACRLENASMRRVNLAITQPSPFSPATPLQTLPVLVLSGQS